MKLTVRQRLALWLDPTPARIDRVHNEILLKSARRCAHDLKHCAGEIYYAHSLTKEQASDQSEFYHARARDWEQLFYPDNGVKNYRVELQTEVEHLREMIQGYRRILRDHGIKDDRDPYADDIPF